MSLGNTAAQAPEYRRQMESSASCPRPRTSECSLTANEFTCLMMQVLSGVARANDDGLGILGRRQVLPEHASHLVDRLEGRLLLRWRVEPHVHVAPLEHGTVEAQQALRRRLLDAVAPGTIRWGAKLASFDASVSEGVSIALTSGEEIRASLLVGADGIFSAVRKGLKLPNDRLKYVGLIVALGIVPDERMEVRLARERVFETARPWQSAFCPPSSSMTWAAAPGTFVSSQLALSLVADETAPLSLTGTRGP